jgi:hypothetical protein
VKRSTASKIKPPQTNRKLPVKTGGQLPSSHFVPALLPPQKVTTMSRLNPMAVLFFFSDTRRGYGKRQRDSTCQRKMQTQTTSKRFRNIVFVCVPDFFTKILNLLSGCLARKDKPGISFGFVHLEKITFLCRVKDQ